MTIYRETEAGFKMYAPASLLNMEFDTAAWTSKYVQAHPWHKWILAKYVEADNANSNAQYWSLEDLKKSRSTIEHTPMNIDHKQKDIVGFWQAAELMYPESATRNPYVETLGVFWARPNQELFREVQEAYELGRLYVSMECEAKTVTCGSCAGEFAYEGPVSNSYCSHINSREAHRQLNDPTFLGGALIMPSNTPGWKNANVKEISRLTTDEEKEELLKEIAYHSPDGSEADWEAMMWEIQMSYLVSKSQS